MKEDETLSPPKRSSISDPGAHDLEDHFSDAQSAPLSPGTSPIPKTRVEKVDDEPSYGEVPGTEAYRMREGDAEPDEIAIQENKSEEETSSDAVPPPSPGGQPIPKTVVEEVPGTSGPHSEEYAEKRKADAPADLVLKAEDDVKDDGSNTEFDAPAPAPAPAPVLPQVPSLPFSIPDFDGLDGEDVLQAVDPYLNTLFPPESLDVSPPPPLTKENPIFLTPRSASLWSQLVAPPPLAPPDWIRSRIRRLFLVSLGVPVDLDEILPASKQKKLVLPSLQVNSSGSPRTSSDSRSVSRVRQEANASTTSVDSKGKPSVSKRKGAPTAPDLDLVSAKQLCTTTEEALNGMTDEELKAHVAKLQAMEGTAKEVLEYWTKKTDEKIGDREAFEGVIENLVKHARKVRK
ncbi:hypothetical protein K4K54_002536 [Colletotrichum sp. SAR 10_86]|nr:hypothetical protein KHU50_006020 [Colletotrichum sp. SAR 10_65]KAI8186324.1 hypothetical protein K4K51_010607 [Colletotrichum sp. SAR 10_75]KAI8212965.1 hypothetical protein K4K52_006556 [Colletotrichum sp. SAR 10_76]KAI8224326.1 hypothetical protein K4K53_006653 [Colletotrichum sp. SAR 10_77]KAI8236652.1 hypothetical protein K4K54_002536 [Colletotrichum sp. SAR 10_86]KAJ4998036.1 hypothetical protein K4K48_005987 [Colletotrichum sp. SAR 10_66]